MEKGEIYLEWPISSYIRSIQGDADKLRLVSSTEPQNCYEINGATHLVY